MFAVLVIQLLMLVFPACASSSTAISSLTSCGMNWIYWLFHFYVWNLF